MKKNLFCILLLICYSLLNAQNYLQVSPRVGYDIIPLYNNQTPYINYKGGLVAGASIDYYWKWFGIGADFDYIGNKPKNVYPTSNLSIGGSPLTNFSLLENKITRYFYGVGPSIKYQTPNSKFTSELNLRAGLGGINGGQTLLNGFTQSNPNAILLNFHSGYNTDHKFAAKAQVRFNYFFNQSVGVHLGAYYLKHFQTDEYLNATYNNATYNNATGYRPISEDKGMQVSDRITLREECKCNVASVGIFAGLILRLNSKPKQARTEQSSGKSCLTCDKYALAVTARDKYTKEILPNSDIALKDMQGNVIKTGTTNSYGVVVFSEIVPENYLVEGVLHNVKLDGAGVEKSEFKPNTTIQKEVIYSDLNFILKGNAVVCNTTTPLEGVSVTLKNSSLGEQKNTITNNKGEFIFNVKQQSIYQIFGKKGGYFSQIEEVNTKEFNRNTTLFIKLEICMNEAECGKAIKLNNIYYDFNKENLRAESYPELNKLVQFLNDNPEVSIELYSHTDSRGTDAYNQKLSQGRANSVVDYLKSKGITGARLKGIGFGESKLLNRCADNVNCTEEEHQINRRTEVKVICPK